MWSHIRTSRRRTVAFFMCVLLTGCNRGSTGSMPQIVFSKVPVADVGGPERMDTIEGRVSGFRTGQRIVLYAKSEGRWWVQPLVEAPFTKVEGHSSWKNKTHRTTGQLTLLQDYKPRESIAYWPPEKRSYGLALIRASSKATARRFTVSRCPRALGIRGRPAVLNL
jgi:hypothetical protein